MPIRPTVWIPHIPRTGGTSRRMMMEHLSEYSEHQETFNSGIPDTDHIVTGHCSVLESSKWIKILFVRNPLQRFWSSYYWTLERNPDLKLENYVNSSHMEELLFDHQPFTSTEHWMRVQQERAGLPEIDCYNWDYIFEVTELTKFKVVMNNMGYAVKDECHINQNNIGHQTRPTLSRPHGPELRKEYKYYNKLGLNY